MYAKQQFFFAIFRITFDCFGATVEYAHFLESQSIPGSVHICQQTKDAVASDFEFVEHAVIYVCHVILFLYYSFF